MSDRGERRPSGPIRLAVGVAVALLTACATPVAPTPEPSFVPGETPEVAAPSYQCTPPGDPSAVYPCHRDAYERQQGQASLEAEAVGVYQRFRAEYLRLLQTGGAEALTPELEATVADPVRRDLALELAAQKRAGQTVQGTVPEPAVAVDRGSRQEDSEVTLRTCDDLRATAVHQSDGRKVSDGRVLVSVRYLKRVDGALKIFASTTEQEDSCPL
ncbi:MAG: hypothetical protein Q4G45_11475 [Actinomycetia bacterium]|nr:hypothetical protein [Actinomycetes bacterium]